MLVLYQKKRKSVRHLLDSYLQFDSILSQERPEFGLTESLNFPEAGISPGIGSVEYNDLIARIQYDITGLRRRLAVIPGEALVW